MRVIVSGATLLAWVSAVLAQTAGFDAVLTPTKDEVVAAGSTYTITWDYTSTYAGTISIQLLEGATSTTLQLGDVIASGIDNSLGQYSWTVDSSLGDDATYGLKITYGANTEIFQYSNPFQISKAATSPSASSVGAPAAATTAAAVAPKQDDASSTLFSTEWVTVTSCAASVTDCPARSTVTSSTVKPFVTTVKPSTASSAPVAGSAQASSPSAPSSSSSVVYSQTGKPVLPSGPVVASSAAAVAVPKTTLSPVYPAGNSTGSGSGSGSGSGAGAGGLGTVTLPTSSATSTGATSSSTSSAIAASGAGRVAAGSVALFAGLMAAVFAL